MGWDSRWTDEKRISVEDMFRDVVRGGGECSWGPVRFLHMPPDTFQVFLNGNLTLKTTDPEEAHKRWLYYVKREEESYILCAAVYVNDGQSHARSYGDPPVGIVFAGLRHSQCLELLSLWADRLTEEERARIEAIQEGQLHGRNQGFLTSTGRYVNRDEAARIAFLAGQTTEEKRGLCSEDLY